MKKIISISLVLFTLIICIFGNVYATINCKVSIQTAKTEFKQNEEFTVDVKISDIQSARGVIAFGAVLEYDKDSLTMVKMEGKNGWSTPSYSEANGKLVMERNGFATKDEVMFQITFKIKEKNKKDILISLNNLEVADGNERSQLGSTNKKITINGTNQNQDTDIGENTDTDIGTGTNTNSNSNNENINIESNKNTNTNVSKNTSLKDNSVSSTKIPKAGNSYKIIVISIIGIIVFILACYFVVKKINKK